jgi:RNA polymerase sigma-70 factor (ECF subfamily)
MRTELVQASELLATGKPEDIERSVALMQKTIFSFAMKVCGHREDAEDTMQEVLVSSLPHLRKIDGPKALAVWLYKAARTRCWMSKRRSKFAPAQNLSLDELMPDGRELQALLASHEANPEEALAQSQDAERVRDAVLRIPPQYRLILVLHDMEDLDSQEVAKIAGLREGTVRVRLHRARLFVRRELSQAARASKSSKTKLGKPPSCRQMFAGLSEYLDGRLDELSCENVQKHLLDCPACVAFLTDLRRAVDRCRKADAPCESKTAAKLHRLLVDEYLRMSASSK